MHIRRYSLILLFSFLAGRFAVGAGEPGAAEPARAMVESERKFYQTGQEKGTRAAFLSFLAEDSIVFRPGPVSGQEAWGKRPETGFDLIWEPTFASIARSADFGYTTGPAKWRANKKEEKFVGYGQFISIWKKQKDGSWKVTLDCGIENPEPSGQPGELKMLIPEEAQPKARPLPEAHGKFVTAAKINSVEAVLQVAGDDVRVYRDGSFPALGKNAAAELLRAKGGKISFEQMGGDMSRSSDLAYSYGKYSLLRDGDTEAGHFFQIWQTDAAGVWKLVVDWQQALPKEKPAK
jgi:ketosteroid isomerase-like protein